MFQLFFTLARAYMGRLPLHYGCAMEENICQVVQYILWNNIWRHDCISMLAGQNTRNPEPEPEKPETEPEKPEPEKPKP